MERREVLHHGLSIELLAGCLLEHFPPRPAGTRRHQRLQEIPDCLASVIVGIVRVLLQDVRGDVVVQLEQERLREGVIVVLPGIVIDVGFRQRVGELLAAW